MSDAALPPGPRLPGVLQAVLFAHAHPWLMRQSYARFGPAVTIRPGTSPPVVLTADPDAARRLLTGDPLERRHGNETLRPMVGDRSLMLLDPAAHLARRKLLLPPFHGERVRGYAALMEELIEEAVARWRPGEVVPVLPVAQDLAIEVIMQAVLGIRDPDLRARLRRAIDEVVGFPLALVRHGLGLRPAGRVPVLPRALRTVVRFMADIPTPAVLTYFPALKERSSRVFWTIAWYHLYERLQRLLTEQIAATRADPGLAERDDVLALLVQARDEDGRGLADEDLCDELITLISAGHETTAAAIAWGADALACDPALQARARRAADEDDDEYLGALVKEILRLRTPLTLAAVRVLPEPFAIGDRTIPPGVHVGIDSYTLHRDPELWPEPERLRPERFLDGSAPSYAWLPFGGGAHRCIGAAMAELEIKVALRAILRAVELEPVEDGPATAVRRAVVLIPHGNARVRVRERPRPSATERGEAADEPVGVGGVEVGDAEAAA